MKNLLKADFFRLCKDKSALVGLIISVALSIVSVVLMYVVFYLILEIPPGALDGSDSIPGIPVLTGEYFMKSVFQSSNNAGIVLAIVIGMIATKDFSFNTIRQKTIHGHSRTNIYLSQFITIVVYAAVVMIINAVISLALGSIFFGYSASGFEASDLLYIVYSFGMGLLMYTVIISLVLMISFFIKSTGITIVIVIGLSFLLSMVYSILVMTGGSNDIVQFFLNLLPDQHFAWYLSNHWMASKELIYSLAMSTLYIVLFTTLGITMFNRTDIK